MEIEFTHRFEAAHRFVGSKSPQCMTPHGHTWWVKLRIESLDEELSSHAMVSEFSMLKTPWKNFIDQTADHSFFHHFDDPLAELSHRVIENFRGLPFPTDPTTEMVAILFLRKAEKLLEKIGGEQSRRLRISQIQIQETPTNGVSLRPESAIYLRTLKQVEQSWSGWWQSELVEERFLVKREVSQ